MVYLSNRSFKWANKLNFTYKQSTYETILSSLIEWEKRGPHANFMMTPVKQMNNKIVPLLHNLFNSATMKISDQCLKSVQS